MGSIIDQNLRIELLKTLFHQLDKLHSLYE